MRLLLALRARLERLVVMIVVASSLDTLVAATYHDVHPCRKSRDPW